MPKNVKMDTKERKNHRKFHKVQAKLQSSFESLKRGKFWTGQGKEAPSNEEGLSLIGSYQGCLKATLLKGIPFLGVIKIHKRKEMKLMIQEKDNPSHAWGHVVVWVIWKP